MVINLPRKLNNKSWGGAFPWRISSMAFGIEANPVATIYC
jgi:hypothetical protein